VDVEFILVGGSRFTDNSLWVGVFFLAFLRLIFDVFDCDVTILVDRSWRQGRPLGLLLLPPPAATVLLKEDAVKFDKTGSG
jgi:hypothetical protein